MNGLPLALGVVGALAVAGVARQRGSRAEGAALRVWHGSSRDLSVFRAPAFFTARKQDAQWYSTERAEAGRSGFVIPVLLSMRNPIDAKGLIRIAREVGVEVTEEPYFEAPEVATYPPHYEGTNPLDLVYIPRVREALRQAGYDGVHDWDLLENTEIPTWITLDDDQARRDPNRDAR